MKYVEAFDLASKVIAIRRRHFEYPDGTAREVALECVGLSTIDRAIEAMSAAFKIVEDRIMARRTNHIWDGSIG